MSGGPALPGRPRLAVRGQVGVRIRAAGRGRIGMHERGDRAGSPCSEPDTATTAAWMTVVSASAANEIHSARRPAALAPIAASTVLAGSWLCGRSACRSLDSTPGPRPPARSRACG